MQLLIISALAATALALPQGGYTPPTGQYTPLPGPITCGPGEVLKGDGSCARPVVTRNLYLYNAPEQEVTHIAPTHFPDPKVHYNFVFVRTPDVGSGPPPVVAPAPQQKTLVYLLSKRPDALQREVIEVPSTPTQPEVFFVQYNEGENAQLPGGIDLQTALSQAAQRGQVISGGGAAAGGSGGFHDSSEEIVITQQQYGR